MPLGYMEKQNGMALHDMAVWYDMLYGLVWFGDMAVWYDMLYGMVWYWKSYCGMALDYMEWYRKS